MDGRQAMRMTGVLCIVARGRADGDSASGSRRLRGKSANADIG
jgi:hypothetical protein